MLATDPLSLVFIGCAVFSGAFLVISTLLGVGGSHDIGHVGHDFHVGHVDGHIGGHDFHVAHADAGGAGHVGHAGHVGDAGHSADVHAAHGPSAHADSGSAQTAATSSVWSSLANSLLGSLNLYGLLMFLLIFGLVGYVAHAVLSWGVVFVVLISLLVGVACAIGLTTLLHMLFATPEETVLTASDARLEGRLGTVTMAIRAGGIGEIIFTRKGGGRQSVGARSASGDAIPAGSEVVILSYEDGIASVESWDTFLAAARTGHQPLLQPIEQKPSTLPAAEQPREG